MATGTTMDTRMTAPSATTATTPDDQLHHDESVSARPVSGVDVLTANNAVELGGVYAGHVRTAKDVMRLDACVHPARRSSSRLQPIWVHRRVQLPVGAHITVFVRTDNI
jgi:hypothetical protein